MKQLKQMEKVLKDLPPEIGIDKFDTHSIALSVRPYVILDDYWKVRFEAFARIKKHSMKIRLK